MPEVIADAAGQLQPDPGANPTASDVTAARQLLATFEGNVADPLLRGAAEEAVHALLNDKPEAVLGYVASRYEVGAAGLPELDKQQVSVTALQAGRVVTDMFQAVLPRDGLAGSLQRVVSPLALALKTLHLLALSVRDGAFPIIWLSLLLAAIATGAAGAIAFQGSAGWPVVVGVGAGAGRAAAGAAGLVRAWAGAAGAAVATSVRAAAGRGRRHLLGAPPPS